MQYDLTAADLEVLLALVRSGKLAQAGERLGVDGSTVFRNLQRIERGLGQRLFARSRSGYVPLELAQALAAHAERMEAELETARSTAQLRADLVYGSVRITSTDTILHGLVAPALGTLRQMHPRIQFDLHCGNELVNLSRRDADIAIRATKRPPEHLVGKELGSIRVALFAGQSSGLQTIADVEEQEPAWIAPDEALPEHPSVLWRKRRFPLVQPGYRVNSILTVMEMVALGLGIGVLPLFLAQGRRDVVQIGDVLDDGQTDLWLLTHPESRHLRRVAVVFSHLSSHIRLD